MINHILVPLDGSTLAECVLPHVAAIAPVTNARVTLLHVMQPVQNGHGGPAVDPIEWHLQKQKLEKYLEQTIQHLNKAGMLGVEPVILEGNPANSVIDFAHNNNVDLIALSTHGQSGLSGWNVSGVVQKILLRSYKSILLARAYLAPPSGRTKVRYKRLLVGMDCSPRAEFVMPFAIGLAQYHKAQLILESVIEKPATVNRLPPSNEDMQMIEHFVERNEQAAARYLEQLVTQFSTKELKVKAHVSIGESAIATLHDMVDESSADLVMLAAHGYSGSRRWPYGSVTTSFIAYGNTPLLIMQDLPDTEIQPTRAEMAVQEGKGR